MADTFDWDNMDDEFKSSFKQYAEDGTYEVKLDTVTKKVASTGSIFFEFNFEEGDDVKYPKISRALFKDEKKKFRAYHYRNIMMVLGATKEAAQKAVETCERRADREAVADAYVQTFNRLAQKHPKVKLEVSTEVNNGKEYARGEFADPSVHFSNNNKPSAPATSVDILPEDGAVDMDLEIPFD